MSAVSKGHHHLLRISVSCWGVFGFSSRPLGHQLLTKYYNTLPQTVQATSGMDAHYCVFPHFAFRTDTMPVIYVLVKVKLLKFIDQSPSWEAKRPSARQEIYSILWNPMFHDYINRSTTRVPILRQMNPVHAPAANSSKTYFNLIIRYNHSNVLFPKRFYIFLLSPICAICQPISLALFHHPNSIWRSA
jgi:hypothetical protein